MIGFRTVYLASTLLGAACGSIIIASGAVLTQGPILTIHMLVGALFLAIAALALGVERSLLAVARIFPADSSPAAKTALRQLSLVLGLAGAILSVVLLASLSGVLSRLAEGYAIFG